MKKSLNLTVLAGRGVSQAQAAAYLADAGFTGCFYTAQEGDSPACTLQAAREAGLSPEFIHAPVSHVDTLWMEGEEGEYRLEVLCRWVRQCAENQVPLLVSHVWTKFAPAVPNELGLSRFYRLLELARQEGIRIAFENAEGDSFLRAVLTAFSQHSAAGFCYDTGHEQCYSDGRDQLALYGDQLLCTHLNDNLGKTGREIDTKDDAHMMPFDGIAPWERITGNLSRLSFSGPLTLEIKSANKPGRHTHDRYAALSDREFVGCIYQRAVLLESMITAKNPGD